MGCSRVSQSMGQRLQRWYLKSLHPAWATSPLSSLDFSPRSHQSGTPHHLPCTALGPCSLHAHRAHPTPACPYAAPSPPGPAEPPRCLGTQQVLATESSRLHPDWAGPDDRGASHHTLGTPRGPGPLGMGGGLSGGFSIQEKREVLGLALTLGPCSTLPKSGGGASFHELLEEAAGREGAPGVTLGCAS